MRKLYWQIPFALAAALVALQFGPSLVTWVRVQRVRAAVSYSPVYVLRSEIDPRTNQATTWDFEGWRADGAWCIGHFLKRPDGQTYAPYSFNIPSTGAAIAVLPEVQGTHSRYYPASSSARYKLGRPDGATNCTSSVLAASLPGPKYTPTIQETYVGKETILGHAAVRLHSEIPAGPKMGAQHIDKWYLADHQCIEVQARIQRDGFPWTILRTATEIRLSEPPAQWFVVPAGYHEMSPSQADQSFADKFLLGKVAACIRDQWTRRDSRYRQNSPRAVIQAAP